MRRILYSLQLSRNPNSNNPLKLFRYSLFSYDIITTKLGRPKMFNEMEQIFAQTSQETRFIPKEVIFAMSSPSTTALAWPNKLFELTIQFLIFVAKERLSNSLDDACKLFDETRRKDIKPNAITFGTLISVLCANLKLGEAFRLKEDMLRIFGLRPNAFVYASLIKGLC
ncbi:PREDICTED: putative pentatricopeptide repeat-containing protein At1g53330 [Nelumbo nucifera]|uniref:Pentatricopeptide repeat-containing protein At1g53330 n=2 Tax=Nelumbo nucifera TaxID=4432 RepID=A0A1U8A0Z9_NELNU|nr:PREDICTED: putative pentatricopeptide repeat-containing protein At1g53330 [Nelumbo nucifera]DAD18981.1 TPA_asm: hypothetical protein HUJ06_020444 [Nelumbo nucifera]